jgi:RNA polymerase sigma factor (sigma-70 family)
MNSGSLVSDMAANRVNQVVGHLRRVALLADGAGQTDGQLLTRFIEERDEAAFAALVRRHGTMVMGVCKRVLRHEQDAQDAFQATFIVLVRKAASIVPREMVGNWLYGVAQQTAIRVRAMNAKRKARETLVSVMPDVAIEKCRDDWTALLDEELTRLPAKYRVVLVLCDLEGRTRKAVAQQFGCPESSISSRLSRGRAMLARRLAKRGLVVSGEALAVTLSQNVASASLAPSLVSCTVKAAVAAGQTAATSTKVAAIVEGVLKVMFLTKLKTLASVSFIVCVLGVGAGASLLSGQTPVEKNQRRAEPQVGAPVTDSFKRKDRDPTIDLPELTQRKPQEESNLADFQRRLEDLEKRIAAVMARLESVLVEQKRGVAQRGGKKDVKIYPLRNLKAEEVCATIQQLFPQNFQEPNGSIAISPSTNTVILYGYPEDLQMSERIISRLEELPVQPVETQPFQQNIFNQNKGDGKKRPPVKGN